jgi:hypothetical protein
MILDFGDGRELKLADHMSDKTARRLGRLILELETDAKKIESASKAAATAREEAVDLRNDVAALRKELLALKAAASTKRLKYNRRGEAVREIKAGKKSTRAQPRKKYTRSGEAR